MAKAKYKATVTFGGPISMKKGEIGNYDTKDIANLIKCGYLEKVGKASKSDSVEDEEESADPAGESSSENSSEGE